MPGNSFIVNTPLCLRPSLKCKIQTINFDVFRREELFFVNSIISSMNYSSEFQAEHTWRLTELHEKNAEYLWSSRHLLLKMGRNYFWKSNLLKKYSSFLFTLVCRIDVHARLLILRKNSPLHGLILVCTFIVFEKKIPLHVYFSAFIRVFALHVY